MNRLAANARAQKQGGILRVYHNDNPPTASLHEEVTIATLQPLRELVRVLESQPSRRTASVTGRLIARLWSLRQMSLSVSGILEAGQSPAIEAARLLAESDATSEDDLHDPRGNDAGAARHRRPRARSALNPPDARD